MNTPHSCGGQLGTRSRSSQREKDTGSDVIMVALEEAYQFHGRIGAVLVFQRRELHDGDHMTALSRAIRGAVISEIADADEIGLFVNFGEDSLVVTGTSMGDLIVEWNAACLAELGYEVEDE